MRAQPRRTAGDILYNFHWVVPGEAARAMQAWAGGLKTFLRRRGIKSIINLRGHRQCRIPEQRRVEAGSTAANERPVLAHYDFVNNHVVAARSSEAVDVPVLDDAHLPSRDHS